MATSREVPKPSSIETEVFNELDARPKPGKGKPKGAAKPNQRPAKKKRLSYSPSDKTGWASTGWW